MTSHDLKHSSSAPGPALVYFGSVDWAFNRQRPQQLASRLAKVYPLVYVDPPGLRSPRLSDWRRVVSRVRTRRVPKTEAPAGHLVVFSPMAYIPTLCNELVLQLDTLVYRSGVERLLRHWGIERAILWMGVPAPLICYLLDDSMWDLVIYDCLDEVASFHTHAHLDVIERTEAFLAGRADIVFASATQLCEKMSRYNPNTHLLPNAADFNHFYQALQPEVAQRIPEDIARIPSPIVGYVGGISHWFDFELVDLVAARRPDVSVVIIGQVEVSADLPPCRPNLFFLGQKPYDSLPNYLARFDVGIIPFEVNHLTTGVSPVKLFEYLAAGLQVVCTDLPEARRYPGVVNVAETPEAFLAFVERAIVSGRAPDLVEQRLAVARNETWQARVDRAVGLMRRSLKNSKT